MMAAMKDQHGIIIHTPMKWLHRTRLPNRPHRSRENPRRIEKLVLFFLVLISHRRRELSFGAHIFVERFDLKFPEMGCIDLEVSTCNSTNAVRGRLCALSDLQALTHVDRHGIVLHVINSCQSS
ncbi:MAG: hypothetical protein WCF90_03175 [Methanomicrobiales archaeon]